MDFAVYDADNHLYEAEDAFTRHLPPSHADLFRFVEIKGRKKLVVRNVITEFIPNPTFEVVAAPGAHMAFYAGANPEGKSLRELTGKPIRPPAAFRAAAPRLELLDEQGIHATLMFPTLASLIEERLLDDPVLTQIALSRLQRVAARRVALRLRGPHLRHPRRQPLPPRRGHRRVGAADRPGRPGRPAAAGAGQRPAGHPLAVPPGVRPVLGPHPGSRPARRPPRLRQRLPAVPEQLGGHPRRVRGVPPPELRRRGRRRAVHPGRSGLGDLPRDAHPLPWRPPAERGERRQLGRPPRAQPRQRLQEDAQRVPRAPPRRVRSATCG